MNESFDENQQNLVNSNRKSAVNEKIKDKTEIASRHRLSDQKWRQNVSKGFAALKTIVKQNRKLSVEQLMTSEGTKEVPLNKKPSMANKRLSRIETLRSTIDLVKTRESVIENLINERQENSPKTDKQSIAVNGLQRIKDMFDLFEKRHESESKEMSSKAIKVEIKDKKPSVEDNHCFSTLKEKTAEPLLIPLEQIKTEDLTEDLTEEIVPKLEDKTKSNTSSDEDLNEWHPLVILKTEYDSSLDIHNNDTNYCHLKDHSFHSFGNCSPLYDSLSSMDNKFLGDYSCGLDPFGSFDYLTTDLSDHLAKTMPLMSFCPSLSYLNDSYV